MVAWAAVHERWGIVKSAVCALVALVLVAAAFMPDWPVQFVRAMVDYAGYARVGPPVDTFFALIFPSAWTQGAAFIALLLLVAAVAWAWSHATEDWTFAFNLTAFVTAALPFV